MNFLRPLVNLLILWQRIWRRVKMLLFRSAFLHHGKHFIFNPNDDFTYNTIVVGDDVSIGGGAAFIASESKIIIGNKVLFGPNVTIIGGNHNTSVVGRYMYDVNEKRPEDDQDVIIEDDVWVGSNVTILKGVILARGCIIGAGSVVTHNIPPYSIAAGIPAKVRKFRFDASIILEHEQKLYPPEKRFSSEFIQSILKD